MRDDEYSDFGFINSVLVFLVSLGLTLVLLWIVSRIIGQPWFENLPDWLTSGLGKILVGLFSGGSLAAIVVKKLASRHSPNFFNRICGSTLGLFIVILLLVFVLRPHQSSAQSPSPVPNPSVGKTQPPPPAPKEELHKTDENGQDYLERWNARGNCREATQDDRHQCIFSSTRRHIGESKDPFDHEEGRAGHAQGLRQTLQARPSRGDAGPSRLGKVCQEYKVSGIPHVVLIDRKGKVRLSASAPMTTTRRPSRR